MNEFTRPTHELCVGVQYATGRSQCWREPTWMVYDPTRMIAGRPLKACDRHLHGAIDRDNGSLVVPLVREVAP